MKIMCDTNVIIDVLLEREPFIEDSYKVLKFCEEHKIDGFVSASSVTDIYYLVRKYTHSTELAYKAVGKLLEIVSIVLFAERCTEAEVLTPENLWQFPCYCNYAAVASKRTDYA